VTALYEQWQAARQLRQDEVIDRRDQVDANLARWQADRLAHAVQLHQDLTQMVADLQAQTQGWLRQVAQQRQDRSPGLRQSLQQYARTLQAETQTQLADLQAQRQTKTLLLQQQLRQDCQARQDTVSDLRLDIVQDLKTLRQRVNAIKQETEAMRAGHRQEQALMRSDLLPQLATYVETLQAEVQDSLATVAALRQQAARAHQAQRQQDRQALALAVDKLFDQLAAFRQELQVQRQTLTAGVWGHGNNATNLPQPASRRPRAASRPVPAKPTAANAKPAPKPTAPVKPKTAVNPQPTAKPQARANPAKPQAKPEPEVIISTPSKGPTPPLDEVVYNYLHLSPGARLSEIEAELGINRFQAVDALRSLMTKDLIIKTDRTYHVQEEAVL